MAPSGGAAPLPRLLEGWALVSSGWETRLPCALGAAGRRVWRGRALGGEDPFARGGGGRGRSFRGGCEAASRGGGLFLAQSRAAAASFGSESSASRGASSEGGRETQAPPPPCGSGHGGARPSSAWLLASAALARLGWLPSLWLPPGRPLVLAAAGLQRGASSQAG